MTEKFLDQAYGLETAEDTRALYDRWATSYDAEVSEHGYATPARVADALKQYTPTDTPVLDFGCGTGLSGLALRSAGFSTVDGMDPSPEMIAGAKAKAAYRALIQTDVDDPAPIPMAQYKAIVCAGVLGTGAAPPEVFDTVMNALPRGGFMAFSYNDHTLADPAFTSKLSEWVDCGAGMLLFREYGDHLPGADLKSEVYIIEKA
ncbi:MAG: class I SAM-dependent DNA methyltransferase [Paracoccaceae bacterium]